MGRIRNQRTDEEHPLRPEHLVGRSRTCDLRLGERKVSSLHAEIRFARGAWQLRDLGSRNGTSVDGTPVPQDVALQVGAVVAFGGAEESWVLVDGSPPRPFAEGLDKAGVFMEALGDLLGLPEDENALATVFRSTAGWRVDFDGEVRPLLDREVIEAGGRWRVHLPIMPPDRTETAMVDTLVSDIALRLAVSRHQEHIEVEVIHSAGTFQLGAYVANELLLALARARLDDPGLPEAEAGWVDPEMLARSLKQSMSGLRQWIYTTRRRFDEIGVGHAAQIIERRPGTREIRLGVTQVSIDPL